LGTNGNLSPAQSYIRKRNSQPLHRDSRVFSKFEAVPFKVVLPANDHGGNQDLSVTLANIGRDLVDPLERAITKPQEAIKCTYRVYIDQANTAPQNTPPLVLTIANVQVTQDTVSATATRADVLNKRFPSKLYRYDDFPGLRR
jgi:hypothetical protein